MEEEEGGEEEGEGEGEGGEEEGEGVGGLVAKAHLRDRCL